jgi:hypothetical protein
MDGFVDGAAASSKPGRLIRWGEAGPPPPRRRFTVGALSFELCGAALDHVAYRETELLRRLAVVVRDRTWGTVPGLVEHCAATEGPDAVSIELRVRHRHSEIDFRWWGRVEAGPDGLAATFDGVALRRFARNRIGWCVLHPLRLAGTPVRVRTPAGQLSSPVFPVQISPHQPLREVAALAYDDVDVHGGPIEVALGFEGDVFETEDHRNWTDASYKTYGTPLELPVPVTLEKDTTVHQGVRVDVTSRAGVAARRAPSVPSAAHAPSDTATELRVGPPGATLAALGFGLRGALTEAEHRTATALRPAYLHTGVDARNTAALEGFGDRSVLDATLDEARRWPVPLRLDVLAEDPGELADLLAHVRGGGVPVEAVHAFDARTHVTTPALADAAAAALAGSGIRLGGGTSAHFAELNRATELPLDRLEEIGYTTAAEMHAEDRASVRETLLAHPHQVRDARALAGDRRLAVGPVGFRPRFNAVVADEPVAHGLDALPDDVDPRQASVFGAAWTVGVLAALAGAADTVTLFDLVGRRGCSERDDAAHHDLFPSRPGEPFPLWAVLAALAPVRGGRMCPVETPCGTAALAVLDRAGALLMVANLQDDPVELPCALPDRFRSGTWRLLAADSDADRGWVLERLEVAPGGAPVVRLPSPSVALLATYDMESIVHAATSPEGPQPRGRQE